MGSEKGKATGNCEQWNNIKQGLTAFYRNVDVNIGRIALEWNMGNNNERALLG
jgi:hypothetical protein